MDLSGLLWCFYQLFGLSFWRHPFTAEWMVFYCTYGSILENWVRVCWVCDVSWKGNSWRWRAGKCINKVNSLIWFDLGCDSVRIRRLTITQPDSAYRELQTSAWTQRWPSPHVLHSHTRAITLTAALHSRAAVRHAYSHGSSERN